MKRRFVSRARHFVIPDLTEAREIVYGLRPEAASQVFHQIQELELVGDCRRGKMHDFDISFDGKHDQYSVVHPRIGYVKFETPAQLVAWVLNQYQ